MKRLILPILLIVLGTLGGAAAGFFLRPDPAAEMRALQPVERDPNAPNAGHEYVRLQNQFIVPLVNDEGVKAHIVLSLSVEVLEGNRTRVLEIEPVLRDAFLEELLAHANTGGFDGSFTSTANLETLRRALTEAANASTGDLVTNVLITDIGRQDT